MVGQINHHLYRKRGFYYFCRRVPKALLEHYPKPRIVVALKTRQFRDALRQSQIISKRLDDQWFHMQLDAMGLDNVQSKLFQPVKSSAPLMSEATSFYLRLKGEGKDKVFIRAAQRNAASVIEVLSDRPTDDYASSEAGKLRDALLEIWQANADGRYNHELDRQNSGKIDEDFRGWGRTGTDFDTAVYRFETIKPGVVSGRNGKDMAPRSLFENAGQTE